MLTRFASACFVSAILACANAQSMKTVTVVHGRVQADTPVWVDEYNGYVSSYTSPNQYQAALDSVNTAAVEGSLMYVQAEGINQALRPGDCNRKSSMDKVVFYKLEIVQPEAALEAYDASNEFHEYGPYMAMDSGQCTPIATDTLSDDCYALYGGNGESKVGMCIGGNSRSTDARAPYPNNVWFDLPSSCVMETFSDKTDSCRQEYSGGLCSYGTKPDGETCTFSYEILGWIKLDDLVGITELGYSNYTEFCEAGNIEFWCEDWDTDCEWKGLDFWKDPFDSTACANRASTMVEKYNTEVAPSNSKFQKLPSIESLTTANPYCHENSQTCANAQYGCKREHYAQLCTVCTSDEDGCVTSAMGNNSNSGLGDDYSSSFDSEGEHASSLFTDDSNEAGNDTGDDTNTSSTVSGSNEDATTPTAGEDDESTNASDVAGETSANDDDDKDASSSSSTAGQEAGDAGEGADDDVDDDETSSPSTTTSPSTGSGDYTPSTSVAGSTEGTTTAPSTGSTPSTSVAGSTEGSSPSTGTTTTPSTGSTEGTSPSAGTTTTPSTGATSPITACDS